MSNKVIPYQRLVKLEKWMVPVFAQVNDQMHHQKVYARRSQGQQSSLTSSYRLDSPKFVSSSLTLAS